MRLTYTDKVQQSRNHRRQSHHHRHQNHHHHHPYHRPYPHHHHLHSHHHHLPHHPAPHPASHHQAYPHQRPVPSRPRPYHLQGGDQQASRILDAADTCPAHHNHRTQADRNSAVRASSIRGSYLGAYREYRSCFSSGSGLHIAVAVAGMVPHGLRRRVLLASSRLALGIRLSEVRQLHWGRWSRCHLER